MKKKNFILYGIILIIILLGAFLVYKFGFKKEDTNLIDITVPKLEEKINNKDSFVLVLSQTGCINCTQYLPELDRALKRVDYEAYVLNLSNINDEEKAKLSKIVIIEGTPTTVFIQNGEEKTSLNRLVGYASSANIIERLKSLGYIE